MQLSKVSDRGYRSQAHVRKCGDCARIEALMLLEKLEICAELMMKEYRFFIQDKCRGENPTFSSVSQRIAATFPLDLIMYT